jgi:3-hydroxyisobutyrate dehydrogenase-like beta-hydroxyacid dehydrogenase
MDVGFLGLGQMGAAIAERLEAGDVRLHVFDPDPVAVAPFVLRGAVDRPSAAAVAQAAPIVFACLPSGAVSEQVAAEVAASPGLRIPALRIYVEMSTIGSQAMARIAQSLATRGVALVDCPISGGPRGARAGTLSVIAAGPPAALDEIRPLLARIGKNLFEVGERPGQAQLMKLVNNLISAANMATAFEALVLGAKGGLDPALMVDVINVSTGRNSATLDKVPKAVLPRTFDYGAKLSTMVKDIGLGLQEAEALGVPMWVHETVGQLWRFGAARGLGDADITALIRVLEDWAGTEVSLPSDVRSA